METKLTNNYTLLGANYNSSTKSVEFSLYSKNATKILLLIFDEPLGQDPVLVLEMQKKENNIWKTSVKEYILNCSKRPVFYGYRVFGANWEFDDNYENGLKTGFKSKFDEQGNRFNPNKVAYDPYSVELSHLPSEVHQKENVFRSGGEAYLIDNAKLAVKSVFIPKEDFKIIPVKPRPFNSEIIGEVHIKDLTQNIDIAEKGTYKGAGKFAKDLKNLGITMVEFLPVNEFDSNQNGVNHWGYMPLGYFSLARKYAYNKQFGNLLREFHEMVNEFHKNNIKVCLDMVFNHTGEAGTINNDPNDANLLSYALIDNSSYYKVFDNGNYRSNSGCGNDFNISDTGASNLIADSIAFWTNQGVDAFRFDLAAALLEDSSTCEEMYDETKSLANKIKDELTKRGIKVLEDFNSEEDGIVLIAEPWTCGGRNCYQLGSFPKFWAEWNDKSRDTIRRLTLRPNEISPEHIKEIFEGSPSIFRGVNKSVNYIASHDGFSLYDLNSYNKKSPLTQGGSDWEICGDWGGDTNKKENSIKKQLSFLFLSAGIPMTQIGDLVMHTKQGNNNSYNQDNEINYIDWKKALLEGSFENRIMEYTKNLINFRKQNPIFRDSNFKSKVVYCYDNGERAELSNWGYWNNYNEKFFGVIINADKRIYLALNQSFEYLTIHLPPTKQGFSWNVCADTSDKNHLDLEPKTYIEDEYILNPQSMVIFTEI